MLTEYSTTYAPQYEAPVQIVKRHEEAHWTEDAVKLQADVEHFKTNKLSEANKQFVNEILRIFTQSDVNVGAGYYDVLMPYFKNNETRNMLGSFAAREGIHQRAYANYSDTLGYGADFHAEFKARPSMVALVQFAEAQQIFVLRSLFRQILMEGVALFGLFASLMQFDRVGLMPGMADVVRWSARDESIHVEGNTWLFRQENTESRTATSQFKRMLYDDARELLGIMRRLLADVYSTGGSPIVTEEQAVKYVEYLTNYRLAQLGLKPVTDTADDPIPAITALFGTAFSNFFEREVVEYSLNNIKGEFTDKVYEAWA